MAISRETLRLLRSLIADVGGQTDDTVRALTAAWIRAWDELDPAWRDAVTEVVTVAAATGRWPAPWELARIERLASAATRTEQALILLAVEAGLLVRDGATAVVATTAAAEPGIIASQLPAAMAAGAAAAYAGRVLPSALDEIVRRTTEQITSLTRPLSDDAMEAVRLSLVRGVAVGSNPGVAARDMVNRVEGAFNGGLTRAITIARSEMLDAYRVTSRYTHEANADVLDSWIWHSRLDGSECPSCWAMHGTVHAVDEPGPLDHQQGRCARVAKAKSWADLGIVGLDEPEDQIPDAEARFAALPRAQQLAIMGRARLALLDSALINWTDLAVRRDNPGWRPSYVPRSVRDLQAIANRRRDGA